MIGLKPPRTLEICGKTARAFWVAMGFTVKCRGVLSTSSSETDESQPKLDSMAMCCLVSRILRIDGILAIANMSNDNAANL